MLFKIIKAFAPTATTANDISIENAPIALSIALSIV